MGVCSDNKVQISHDQGQTQTRALLTKVQTEPKERDLCNILCTPLFQIDSNAVPSLEDLDRYKWHLALLTAKKVSERPRVSPGVAHKVLTGS